MRYLISLFALATLAGFSCERTATTDKAVIDRHSAAEQLSSSPGDTTFFASTQRLRSNVIPSHVFSMTQLRHLLISGMDCDYQGGPPCWMLREIPPAIGQLQQLRTLAFPVNAIRRLPTEIGQLRHLRSLDLTDNPGLSDIEPIAGLASLEELTLYGCNISRLPATIGWLKRLKKLGLIGNPLAPGELARVR